MIKVSEMPRRNGYEQVHDLAYFDYELRDRAGTRLIPILQFEVNLNSGMPYGTHKYIYKLIDKDTNEIIRIYDEKVDKYFEPSEFKIPEDRVYTAFKNPIGETKFDLRGVSLAMYYEVCQCINRPQEFYDVSIVPINFYITQAIAFGDEYRFEGIRDWFKTTIKYEMEPDALRVELENLFNQCLPAFNKK